MKRPTIAALGPLLMAQMLSTPPARRAETDPEPMPMRKRPSDRPVGKGWSHGGPFFKSKPRVRHRADPAKRRKRKAAKEARRRQRR